MDQGIGNLMGSKSIALITQRSGYDCGICAIAMATGHTYERVIEAAGDDLSEKGLRSEVKMLQALGYCYDFQNGHPIGDFVCRHRGHVLDPNFFREFAWGRRALMSVPSLNDEESFHMIYWDGNCIFDPSPKKTYTEWRQLLPDELTLFRECN